MNAQMPGTMAGIKFSNSLEPARENTINNALMFASPGSQAAMAGKQSGVVNQQLTDTIHNIGNEFDSQGLSVGAKAGAIGDANNSATNQKNQINQLRYDPQYQLAIQGQLNSMIQQGQQVPGLNVISQGANMVNGQAPIQVHGGLGEVIGSAFGQWAGGGFPTGGK